MKAAICGRIVVLTSWRLVFDGARFSGRSSRETFLREVAIALRWRARLRDGRRRKRGAKA